MSMNSQRRKEKRTVQKRRLRAVLCWFLFAVSFFLSSIASASGPLIGDIEIKGLHSVGEAEFLSLLDIATGEPVDAETVRAGIKRAFLKGIFEDITVEIGEGEKAKAVIRVKERDYIERIDISGDYALSGKTIKALFSLKAGQTLMCDTLAKAVEDLKPRIAVLGFPHAAVKAEIERLAEPYRIAVRLHIDTGAPDRIKKIYISGAGDEVISVMKLSEGDVYNREKMKKDIERIREYYKEKEYFKPVVGPYTFADGVLSLSVHPGKRLQISVEGNDAVSTKALLKEMPFFDAEDFSDAIVEEAVQRVLALYHTKGYPFAQIAPVMTSKDDVILLSLFIFEGRQVKIRKITFAGNTLPEAGLKEIMSLKEGKIYNPDLIDSERQTLGNFYSSLGYLSAAVGEFQTKYEEGNQAVDITVRISEGLKTSIEQVDITGANVVSEEELRKIIALKPGDAYNEIDISDARFRVIEYYSLKGFPDAIVSAKREIDGQKARITYQIQEGEIALFGKVIVTGNHQTNYTVVQRELLQQEGTPFNYSLLTKERQKLYKLGLFTDINIEKLDSDNSRKDVLIRLREGNAGAVELSVGYAEYERYRGVLDVGYRNFFGMNRQGSVRFELSSLEKRYVLQYYEPWFLGSPIAFRTYILGEDKKEINVDTRETRYRLTRNAINAGFEKKITDTIKAELYYEFSLVNTFDVQPDIVLSREDTGTLVISGLRCGVVYDTRDNPFNPSNGFLSGISIKATSPVFFSETDFVKLIFYGNVYHRIASGLVLAVSLRGGLAQGYLKTDELPIVERFFLGGRTTVRGYIQDGLGPKGKDGTPIGGNAFLMENLELRIAVTENIGLVTFLDGGNVWLKMDEMSPGDFKFTTGPGLRYNTPVGPLRVDYGYKLQREKGESAGEVHFSIGHAF
jgi:outer membrane protein insertion porin family